LFKNNVEEEADFCEAYKSQILNNDSLEEESSFNSLLKVLTILILLAIIIAVSIYGYNYFTKNSSNNMDLTLPPPSVQTIDDSELKVTEMLEKKSLVEESKPKKDVEIKKEPKIEKNVEIKKEIETKLMMKVEENNVVKVITPKFPKIEDRDIEQIANDVKIAIAKSEENEKNNSDIKKVKIADVKKEEKIIEVPSESSQSAYLEELAKLSEEVDKERE